MRYSNFKCIEETKKRKIASYYNSGRVLYFVGPTLYSGETVWKKILYDLRDSGDVRVKPEERVRKLRSKKKKKNKSPLYVHIDIYIKTHKVRVFMRNAITLFTTAHNVLARTRAVSVYIFTISLSVYMYATIIIS